MTQTDFIIGSSVKWKMLSHYTYEGRYEDYIIAVNMQGALWNIIKDKSIVDSFLYHRPPNNLKDSTTVRIHAERALLKLIKQPV